MRISPLATGVQPIERPEVTDEWFAPPLDQSAWNKEVLPYDWDEKTGLSDRPIPGMRGGEYILTGLAHNRNSKIAYDSASNQEGMNMRSRKLTALAATMKPPEIHGDSTGDLLIVGWGSTLGAIEEAVDLARAQGHKVSSVHLRFLSPLEPGLKEIFSGFKKVMTVEINYSDEPDAPLINEDNRRISQLAFLLRAHTLMDINCWSSRIMFGLKGDWSLDVKERYFTLQDYCGAEPRWCTGCGDHGILAAVHRVCRDAQIKPEKTVAVSGIGCSSRLPHYMNTYGFHGLHGRALPVACGVKSRRPDLDVWVATGDGDCFSIGAAHWVHAMRYNMDITLLVFDNGIYGLTKKQTSPTTPLDVPTNTHPSGALLPPLNPLTVTLGVTNISFVAQIVDWNAPLRHEVIKMAHEHKGTSFVRIIQRCPVYVEAIGKALQDEPARMQLLTHENGVQVDDAVKRLFPNHAEHDPSDLAAARMLAEDDAALPLGILYRNPDAPRYDLMSSVGLEMSVDEKLAGMNAALDHFAI
jgi:2-oxoglutarate ferredoxin oxidoreductase subunit beta